MKRVTIEVDYDFSVGLSITAVGIDNSAMKMRMANTIISPHDCNFVMITNEGEIKKEWRKEEDDAAD